VGVIEKTSASADILTISKPIAAVLTAMVSEEDVSVKAGISPKVPKAMNVTELPIVTEVSKVVFVKALELIVVTESGMVTVVSPVVSKA
jgi:hypothetical protein